MRSDDQRRNYVFEGKIDFLLGDCPVNPEEEWGALVEAGPFIEEISRAAKKEEGIASADEAGKMERQLGFDGEATFIVNGTTYSGRFHAAKCFGGDFFMVMFRSLKKPKASPAKA